MGRYSRSRSNNRSSSSSSSDGSFKSRNRSRSGSGSKTRSRSRSASARSFRSEYSLGSSSSNSSSKSIKLNQKKKKNADESQDSLKKEESHSKKTASTKGSLSSSNESLKSVLSTKSLESTIRVIDEFSLPEEDLPLNVLQLLLSIRESEININNLKLQHEENLKKLKIKPENKSELEKENEKIEETLLKESIGVVALSETIYGNANVKSAYAHINLALIYLECKNLPIQAKLHCEKAWQIQLDGLKEEARLSSYNLNEIYEPVQDINKERHQMVLNFVYGRANTLLKENEEGQSALEKANDYLEDWLSEIETNRKYYIKMKPLVLKWKKKIYLALAKQFAINGDYANAFSFYEKTIHLLVKERNKLIKVKEPNLIELNWIDELLIEINQDRSKIEQSREHEKEAADYLKETVKIAEANGSSELIADCKLNLAKFYAPLDDISSTSNAERLFNESIQIYKEIFTNSNKKLLKAQEEEIKFLLKQEKLDDACNLLFTLIKEQIEFYGDFNVKIALNYKLLCSIYLKKNDMPNAAVYLQKAFEIEELNYGSKDKRTLATRETLDNFKKNPNVLEKLKINTKETEKPSFHVGKIDYNKTDKKLYSKPSNENKTLITGSTSNNNNVTQDLLDESNTSFGLSKKINPIK